MKRKFNIKKGEMSTQQIVLLVILIISFIIILFFIFRLNFNSESEKEVCRNSVVMKGTSSVSSEALPLKCSRSYICITQNGDCTGMVKPEKKKVKTEEELYQVLGDEMADCWWMFGEGKVNYIGDTVLKKNYCSICSQIFFDGSLTEIKGLEKGEISKDKLYDYLSKTKMSTQDMTYAEYILGTNNINGLKAESLEKEGVGTFGTIYVGRNYYLVTGITSEISTIGWVLRGAAAGGAVLVTAATFGVGSVSFTTLLIAEGVGGTVGGTVGTEIASMFKPEIGAVIVQGKGVKNTFMVPTIQEANSEKFKNLNCEEVISTA
jgi:hypothetical protein